MNEHHDHVAATDLLGHATFMRSLARSLLHDVHHAEDVEQQAWLALLETSPRRHVRSWLAVVVRQLSWRLRRGEARRRERERAVATREATLSASAEVERLDLLQVLVDEIKALEPCQRQLVLLHFYDGLSLREIARREGVPRATIQSRLHRALAILRHGLDRRYGGDRPSWMLGLLPLAASWKTASAFALVPIVKVVTMVLVVGCASWFTWRTASERSTPAPMIATGRVISAGSSNERSTTIPRTVLTESSVEQEHQLLSAQQTPTIQIHGTVVVIDAAGLEHHSESGSFDLWLCDPTHSVRTTSTPQHISVEAGVWSAVVPADKQIEVDALVLGRHPARREGGAPPMIAPRASLEVRALWPVPTRLRVVDDETGGDLRHITIVRPPGRYPLAPLAIREEEVLVRGAASPLLFPEPRSASAPDWNAVCWVRAAGHAWEKILVDHALGGDRIVRLERDASLEVVVPGFGEGHHPPGMLLRLRTASAGAEAARQLLSGWFALPDDEIHDVASAVCAQAPIENSAPLVFDALKPRSYEVSVECGDALEPGSVLAFRRVALAPGQHEHVLLDLSVPSAGGIRVPLNGTIDQLPFTALAGPDDPVLSFEPIGIADASSAAILLYRNDLHLDGGRYRWDAGLVTPGKYRVTLGSLEGRIEVGPRGSDDLALDSCERQETVRVRVIDAVSGEEVADANLSWWCERPPWTITGEQRVRGSTYEFFVPAGPLELCAGADAYMAVTRQVDVHGGDNDVALEMHRASGVELILTDGSTRLPWHYGSLLRTRFEPLDSDQQISISNFDVRNGVMRITRTPGRYRLHGPVINGYEQPPPVEITIPEGAFAERVIELRRK